PMEPLAAALRAAGADVRSARGRLPLKVNPVRPRGGTLKLSTASAQIKSALLLAGLGAAAPLSFGESAPSRDHTERLLGRMGARLRVSGRRSTVYPGALKGRTINIPGDLSSAAFFIAAALLSGLALKIKGVGLNPGRLGFVRTLRKMGARITVAQRIYAPEPAGDITVRPSALRAARVPARDIPSMIDEAPLLALLAARARGATVIRGAEELRKKESDRVQSTLALLASLGAKASYRNGTLTIPGGQEFKPLKTVETFKDHRVAMAAAAASVVCPGLKIKNPGCVDKSYPGFFRDFRRTFAGGR
ncbi:MAG: 3-phosphoshikimate 1-carboxyvinyltransferase, partial [Elusimicrobia bacterium]